MHLAGLCVRRHALRLAVCTPRGTCRLYSSGGTNSRNIAIIAHVDHGKTTLVDCLLRQSGTLASSNSDVRVMDSNVLERERGITILAKCTSIELAGALRVNVVDTPGHADFGGEVERALKMVDGVVLVVDATEGPMAQTKFVLSKALGLGLVPIVVQNKVDRESSRCDDVDCEILDLFMTLNASDAQLGFSTVYASARSGWAFSFNPFARPDLFPDRKNIAGDMSVLFNLIREKIPPPRVQPDRPFSLLVNNVDTNAFVGKCLLGKIESGSVKIGDRIRAIAPDGRVAEENRVTRMLLRRGVVQSDISEAHAGDIVSIAGIQAASVNYTIGSPEVSVPLEVIPVDPPTVSMVFTVNTSPLLGTEGKNMTTITLSQRLKRECENNISLRLQDTDNPDAFEVSGRGELQLSILIETIRREGHEISVSPPRVLTQQDGDGRTLEPVEEVTIDCAGEYAGGIIEKLSRRKAELTRMSEGMDGKSRMVFKCPMRGLLGFASELKNDTKGTAVLAHAFMGYEPHKGALETSRKGCMISMADGVTTAFALGDLEARGVLFVGPGTKVYNGMVIGECSRVHDLEVNPCKTKALTNVRSTVRDEFSRLIPPQTRTLEELISYMADDEMLEVTPQSIRLRKCDLDPSARRRRGQSKRAATSS